MSASAIWLVKAGTSAILRDKSTANRIVMKNVQSVRALTWLCIINKLEKRAGVVQWQYRSFPSFGRGFDSHRPLQKSAKFTLIRLPLLTGHPPICAQKAGVLRPFCAQVLSERRKPQDEKTQEIAG
jgi:hypothetical protein